MKRLLPWLAVLVLACPALAAQQTTVVRETTTTIHIPAAEYDKWQRMGYSTNDIFMAYNAAAAANRPVDEIFAMRKAGRSWDRIARDTRINVNQIYGTPASRVAGERIEVTRGRMAGSVVPMTGYPIYERKLPDRFFKDGYHLTPREYYRLRASGLTREEVFLIANVARETGLPIEYLQNRVFQGMTARDMSVRWGVDPDEITYVNPEWRTAAWAAAVNEPVYTDEKVDIWW